MATRSWTARSISIRLALTAALALCAFGSGQAEGLTQAEMSDLRAELVAMSAAQPLAGMFSAEELADLRKEARALTPIADFGLSTVPIHPFTEAELRDLRQLAHQHQLSHKR